MWSLSFSRKVSINRRCKLLVNTVWKKPTPAVVSSSGSFDQNFGDRKPEQKVRISTSLHSEWGAKDGSPKLWWEPTCRNEKRARMFTSFYTCMQIRRERFSMSFIAPSEVLIFVSHFCILSRHFHDADRNFGQLSRCHVIVKHAKFCRASDARLSFTV